MSEPLYNGKPASAYCVPYVFFRKEGFYTVNLSGDEDVIPNVERNPGTLRVEDITGRVVWPVLALVMK